MGRIIHHTIYNGNVQVHTSDFLVEFNSESVLDPDTNPIKSIDYDEMDHLLEFLHSENDEDIMYVGLHMLQSANEM